MRLGNYAEAEQAANFIGRQHTFVLSQLTATLGGNETHTRTETEGYGVTGTSGVAFTSGWQESGDGGRTGSGGLSRSQSTAVSRNWSTALSWATGTNWSDAATHQPVYEYAVEPTALQSLPDHALLLVHRGTTGSDLQPVECDPAIITLPRVSTTPLTSVPMHGEIRASTRDAGPTWAGRHAEGGAHVPQSPLPPPSRSQWRHAGAPPRHQAPRGPAGSPPEYGSPPPWP